MLCIEFLRAFSGKNVSRLLVAGMLTDLSVEHCTWVRGEDVHNPDAGLVPPALAGPIEGGHDEEWEDWCNWDDY